MYRRLEEGRVDEWWPVIGEQGYMERFHPAYMHAPGFLPD
jgi:hypothetical protein